MTHSTQRFICSQMKKKKKKKKKRAFLSTEGLNAFSHTQTSLLQHNACPCLIRMAARALSPSHPRLPHSPSTQPMSFWCRFEQLRSPASHRQKGMKEGRDAGRFRWAPTTKMLCKTRAAVCKQLPPRVSAGMTEWTHLFAASERDSHTVSASERLPTTASHTINVLR